MSIAATESITIGPVTLAFPHLFKPQAPPRTNAEPKYNTSILLTAEQYAQVYPLMMQCVNGAFRAGEDQHPTFKWPIQPCTAKPDYYPVAAQRGMYVMRSSAGAEYKPRVVDHNQQDVIDPGVVRDGGQAYVSINFYDYNTGSTGVSCGLGPVMFIGQGEVLNTGGGVSVDVAFANVPAQAAAPQGMPGQAQQPGVPGMAPVPGQPVPQGMPPGQVVQSQQTMPPGAVGPGQVAAPQQPGVPATAPGVTPPLPPGYVVPPQ